MKIFIIEDEEIVANLLSKKLSQQGYEVKIAANSKDGLIMLKEKPDLLLMDIAIPQEDGFATIAEIRGDPILKALSVIIISNSGQPAEIDKAKSLGVKEWIVKTEFDLKTTLQMINEALEDKLTGEARALA